MDLGEKEKFELEKGSGVHLNYHNPGIPADWRFGNPQMGLVAPNTSIPVCQNDQMGPPSSCPPPASMADSFCPGLWDHAPNSLSLGFCEVNIQASTSAAANMVPIQKPIPESSRLDMGWNPSVLKGSMFLQNGAGILPPSLSQFPADSAFIERAARFSCFNDGNFSGMLGPFGMDESLSPYSSAQKGVSGVLSQKNELIMGEAFKEVSMSVDNGSNGGCPVKTRRDTRSIKGAAVSGKESSEPEFSKSGQEALNSENTICGPSLKGLAAKKRKRGTQEMDIDQAKADTQPSVEISKENAETKPKAEQNNSTLAAAKPSGKHGKDGSEAPKEDYIHVRARRGQATNSHSLAERVRREKISERMKFLQDLVPGCSKVTGKAVMLDEIINYVQSLQRQVEFLSMKLSAVNPHLDFNIEGLLSREILPSRSGSSSVIGFSPDMAHPQLHPAQQGLVPSGVPGMGNPSDALRRALTAQLTAMNTYKEPHPQMPNVWDDALHNAIQMGFGTNTPTNIHESNGNPRDGFPG